MARIGAINSGGVCRLAFSDTDLQGRDTLVSWMHEIELAVNVDITGNILRTRTGRAKRCGEQSPGVILNREHHRLEGNQRHAVGVPISGYPHSDWPLSGHAYWMMNALQPIVR